MTDDLLHYPEQREYTPIDERKLPALKYYFAYKHFRLLLHRSRDCYLVLCSINAFGYYINTCRGYYVLDKLPDYESGVRAYTKRLNDSYTYLFGDVNSLFDFAVEEPKNELF